MISKLEKLWETKTQDDELQSFFFTSPLAMANNYYLADVQ